MLTLRKESESDTFTFSTEIGAVEAACSAKNPTSTSVAPSSTHHLFLTLRNESDNIHVLH